MQWYINRLKLMSASEIAYRTKVLIKNLLEKKGFLVLDEVPAWNHHIQTNNWIYSWCEGQSFIQYCNAAEKLIKGYMSIFALGDIYLGHPPQWNQDPKTGIIAPLFYGKSLNYRDNKLVGNIKYLWELNRHLHLVTLAQAYCISKDKKYINGIQCHIQSWIKQCPYPLGPNWSSPLELAIRLINWSIVWQMIGGLDSPLFYGNKGLDFQNTWLRSIYVHCHFISKHLSCYSSANNHIIGEVAGMFIASQTWPYWDEMRHWGGKAKRKLEHECLKQNSSDGVNFEQSIAYSQFVIDFLLLSALAGQVNGIQFSQAYWNRIERMLECFASFMDVDSNMPMIGDADDGYVVRLSQEKSFCPYRSLLATGAVLFNRSDFKYKAFDFDHKSMCLLGKKGEDQFEKLEYKTIHLPIRRAFPQGGYYILGKDFETNREIKGIADCGPLGYLSIAAHGHADALSFVLSISGKEFLIDPGTYAYHTKKRWRNFFRGTSAHNTIRIDELDQSVRGGNFMWLKKANASCLKWGTNYSEDVFQGWHDGYLRLKDPVIHKRTIYFQKDINTFIINDNLHCKEKHKVELFWHFAEDCSVELIHCGCKIIKKGITIILKNPDKIICWSIYKGNKELPLGWVSRKFDVKEACSTLVGNIEIKGQKDMKTIIKILFSENQNTGEE